jgi:hypothetical protein
MKKINFAVMVIVIGIFFLLKIYSFQFGLGAKGFVKKVVEKGQSEGKIAKTEEEKKLHDKYPDNHAPTISSLTANPVSVFTGEVSTITCTASDPDGDTLTYTWTATGGTISGSGSSIFWTAPLSSGTYTITCTVSDGKSGSDTKNVNITVTPTGNTADTAVCLTSNSILDDQNPAFSPDGQFILFSSKRNGNGKNLNIWKMDISGKNPVALTSEPVADNVNMPGTSWNGVRNKIAFSSDRTGNDEI